MVSAKLHDKAVHCVLGATVGYRVNWVWVCLKQQSCIFKTLFKNRAGGGEEIKENTKFILWRKQK